MDPATGGPCQGIRNVIPQLQKLGISNEVVCLDAADATFLQNDPFTIHALGASRGFWKYHPSLYSWLIRNMERYDVILVRGLWLYHSYAALRAFRYLKRRKDTALPKVYLVPHGMLDPWFQQASGRRWKAIRNLFYWHLIEKRIVRSVDGLLFTCSSEMELARQTFKGYQPKRELNIGYGIQKPPVFRGSMRDKFQSMIPFHTSERYILFLGRLHAKKGVDLLLEAYLLLLNEQGQLPMLMIAGPGLNTAYGQQLQSFVNSNSKLKDRVFFTGMLTGDSKWSALYHADAFVLPSHQENFGIAVVEALACGKPVLITNQINIYNEILEGNAGFVADDTLDGVTALLRHWMRISDTEKSQFAARAKALYEREFTVESAALKLIQMLGFEHH